MRSAYIIPGFGESATKGKVVKEYKAVGKLFQKKGIKPIFVEIKWKRKTMSDYVKEFRNQYKGEKNAIFLGFSFGAMISLISSPELQPKKLILCSLSPYFKEDIPKLKSWWKKYLGKKRMSDLEKYSLNKIAKKIKSDTHLILGSEEINIKSKDGVKLMVKRSKGALEKIKKSRLIIAKGAKHRIGQKEYLKTLDKVISKI